MISDRAYQVFKSLRFCKSIQWIPVTVKNNRGKILSDSYWYAHAPQWHDVLDYIQSEYDYYVGTDVIDPYSIKRWVMDSVRIPEYDLFYEGRSSWFATQALKEATEEAQLNCFRFIPVEVSA